MIKIIRSGFYTDGAGKIFEEIKKITSSGEKSILIVPEQQTVMTEGLISKIIPPSSATLFEVTNFTRFANTIFRALGGLSGEYCDSAKSSLIMWRVLTELSPLLTMTAGRREINAGTVSSALSAVAEMQSHGIHPQQLAEAADSEEIKRDARLSGKLSDLAKIYALYKKLLSEKYSDSGDTAEAMLEKLTEHPNFLSDTKIFIEGFTSFTEPQYRLIGVLAQRCEVTIQLTAASVPEAFEFTEIRECESRIINAARRTASEVKLVKEEGYVRRHRESLREICSELWTSTKPKNKIDINRRNNSSSFESKTPAELLDFSEDDNNSLQNSDVLRIFEAITPFEECEFVAADIRRRVMNGASFSSFAIICRNTDKYAGILDGALNRAKIPAFMSYRRDVSEFEAVKLIYSAYSAVRSFNREDVITYAKCSLSGIERDACDEFEIYVNKWQINGKRFIDGELWNMNPAGYTVSRPSGTDEKLLRINETRKKIISPLEKFSKQTATASTVGEQAKVLLDFLLEINMTELLEKRSARLLNMGEELLAKECASLWGVIVKTLDTLYDVAADFPCDRDTFLAQLKVVLSSSDIGAIPAFADEVTVGQADMLRLRTKPHVYMIGVNAGEFPASVNDISYFSEHDKAVLSAFGLSVQPELETRSARELYVFSRAFSYASESITLSYSACNTSFKSTARAEVIDRISLLTGGDAAPVKISSLDIRDRIYSPDDAIGKLDNLGESYPAVKEALTDSGYGELVRISEGTISNGKLSLGREVIDSVYSGDLSLTQSRIDKYVSCPFGHFCKYTVKLSDDERAEFNAASIGSFIHAVLENFFRELTENKKEPDALSREERSELTRKAAEKYLAQLGEEVSSGSNRTRIKIERLCRAAMPVVDGLCEEFGESDFKPKFFELSLTAGDDGSPSPVTFSTERGDVRIWGVIDRVDTYKSGEDVYIRVVDYKTGQKAFSPDDMEKGANLQMYLYLKSLIDEKSEKFRDSIGVGKSGRAIPAGVIYLKTAVSDVRIDTPDDKLAEEAVKAEQGREGMILNDEKAINAMKLKYTPVFSSKTPDKISAEKNNYLFDEESFGEIMKTVEKSVTEVANNLRDGKIEAAPKRNKKSDALPCEYCEFKPICRSAAKK